MKPNNNIPIKYSQNFLKPNPWLVSFVAQNSSISSDDTVIDIGAGSGALTKMLSNHAGTVMAFELDKNQAKKIPESENVQIIIDNFLNYDLSKLGKYKVFANIPFFLTASIIRKLFIDSTNNPEIAFLFMQSEVAARVIGSPLQEETLFSLLLKPFWDIKIIHKFKSSDFIPEPSVDVVLVEFKRKQNPDIKVDETIRYYDFVSFVLNTRKPNIKLDLLPIFSYKQLQIISRKLKFKLQSAPKTLNYQQWLNLYDNFKTLVSTEKQEQTYGAFNKINRHKESQDNKNIIY